MRGDEMKEFTSEWITEQKKLVEKLPRFSKYEYIDIRGKELICVGNIDLETNSSNASPLLFVEYEDDAKAVRDCILNYFEALDHIEHLQKRVEELEGLLDVVEDKKQTVFEVLKNTITRRDEYIVKLENKISDINLHIAKAEARIQELEDEKQAVWKEWLEETKKKWDEEDKQELKNKCANCGLAISHGIWGDEDNDYDNLPKLPQDEE